MDFDAYPGIPFDGKGACFEPQSVVNQNVTQFNVRVASVTTTPAAGGSSPFGGGGGHGGGRGGGRAG